ncbi:disulfide formation protein [uncultured archaeon]|nr:disulfide formation protein [uncultured archaeon]
MADLVDFCTQLLSSLTLMVHAALLAFAARWVLRKAGVSKKESWPAFLRPARDLASRVFSFLQSHALPLAALIALAATLGSLFFSEVAGWEPCKLCWFQRIFMYPQAAILLLALWRKERSIWPYTLALSILGGSISAYHYSTYLLSLGSTGVCSISGGPSCLINYFTSYGYITLPLMAFTASLSIALISWFWLREKKE